MPFHAEGERTGLLLLAGECLTGLYLHSRTEIILCERCNIVFTDAAAVAVGRERTALELNRNVHAENEAAEQHNDHENRGKREENLAGSVEITDLHLLQNRLDICVCGILFLV